MVYKQRQTPLTALIELAVHGNYNKGIQTQEGIE